jgi:hypothetical protein
MYQLKCANCGSTDMKADETQVRVSGAVAIILDDMWLKCRSCGTKWLAGSSLGYVGRLGVTAIAVNGGTAIGMIQAGSGVSINIGGGAHPKNRSGGVDITGGDVQGKVYQGDVVGRHTKNY